MTTSNSLNLADLVTVVMSQRERFSTTRFSLSSLFKTIPDEVRVIFVDGASGPELQAALREFGKRRPNFEVTRHEHYLRQHTAFNIGYRLAKTPYIAFVDNDVLFTRRWLETLVETAEKTGAALVGPLYLEQMGQQTLIHMAGGVIETARRPEGLVYSSKHVLPHAPVDKAQNLPEIEDTDLIEYHTFLSRKSFLDEVGGFDEGLRSARNHEDICLCAKALGLRIVLNRGVTVKYLLPPPITKEDREFYRVRWSWPDTVESHRHFSKKWGVIALPHPFYHHHRRNFLFSFFLPILSFAGFRNARRLYFRLIDPILAPGEERAESRFLARLRDKGKIVEPDVANTYSTGRAFPSVPLEGILRIA